MLSASTWTSWTTYVAGSNQTRATPATSSATSVFGVFGLSGVARMRRCGAITGHRKRHANRRDRRFLQTTPLRGQHEIARHERPIEDHVIVDRRFITET